jgi:hypothetical protein
MLKKIIIFCITFILFSMLSINAAQAQSRTTLPNDFGFEFLGKALGYSLSYQRMVTSYLGLQAGLSALGEDEDTIVFLPFGGQFYFISKNGSPLLTGGIVVLTGDIDTDLVLIESTTYGYAGLGFEYRTERGFLFRGTIYGLFTGDDSLIWPGVHVGYAF